MTERPTVLLPIKVLKGESLPDGIPELLAGANVVLLGYHVIPEQTATGQARSQFESRANERLDEFETMLSEAGATVEHRLVFTHNAQKTINRMIDEHNCEAVLAPSSTQPVTEVLVAVRGTIGIDRIARVVAGLFAGRDIEITLAHVMRTSESSGDAETLLDGLASRLEDRGVSSGKIHQELLHGQRPLDALAETAEAYDAVVLGESDPSLLTYVFGLRPEQVVERFLGPVLVVQRERGAETE